MLQEHDDEDINAWKTGYHSLIMCSEMRCTNTDCPAFMCAVRDEDIMAGWDCGKDDELHSKWCVLNLCMILPCVYPSLTSSNSLVCNHNATPQLLCWKPGTFADRYTYLSPQALRRQLEGIVCREGLRAVQRESLRSDHSTIFWNMVW